MSWGELFERGETYDVTVEEITAVLGKRRNEE